MKLYLLPGVAGLVLSAVHLPPASAQYVDDVPPNLRPYCRQVMIQDFFSPRIVWECPPSATGALTPFPRRDSNVDAGGARAGIGSAIGSPGLGGSTNAPGVGSGGTGSVGGSIGPGNGSSGSGGPKTGDTVADGGPGGVTGPGGGVGPGGDGSPGKGRGPKGNNGFGNGGDDGSPNGKQDVTR